MSLVVHSPAVAERSRVAGRADIRIALLGLGNVGSAVARLAARLHAEGSHRFHVEGALVRDVTRSRPVPPLTLTTDPGVLFKAGPDVLVEVLGGIEPARSLVLDALSRGIPVVTANKSLLAAHGGELAEAASRAGVPLRFEASVLAGVPLLAAFEGRPLAASSTGIAGILNGTSNFILDRMERGGTYAAAVEAAQRLGLAEPDPCSDVDGIDAAEKLAVLLQFYASAQVDVADIPRRGLGPVTPADLRDARACGGAIKPVAAARWNRSGDVQAFVAPAFVPAGHPLAALSGVLNGVSLANAYGPPLFFSGPGAGPDVTAATILDDVIAAGRSGLGSCRSGTLRAAAVRAFPEQSWFIRLKPGVAVVDDRETVRLLESFGVCLRRTCDPDGGSRCHLSRPCPSGAVPRALDALRLAFGCEAQAWPVLESDLESER
jgi:homoserine dehydrogenase